MPAEWISIAEATSLLGVSRATVYAYVSRGLLRSVADQIDPRKSLYLEVQVRALAERSRRDRSRQGIAASSTDWGDPVLLSGLTEVANGRFHYRGLDAIELSRTASLEEVAALLWQVTPVTSCLRQGRNVRTGTAASVLQCCVASLAARVEVGPWTQQRERSAGAAYAILQAMVEAAAGWPDDVTQAHEALSAAWTGKATAADAIRRCLVLCADHELNASAYAARVVASTGAALGACALAGLAALTGPRHGGMTAAVRTMLSAQPFLADPDAELATRVARGENIPGFGHRLYPDGDPRAAEILGFMSIPPRWSSVVEAVERLTGQQPNLDFALVAAERSMGLPAGAAFAIFAVGRTVGWIAHSLEQWQDPKLIRPRASYVVT
jgi:citrate synthase